MIIIGCDYHPGFQQIAFVDTTRANSVRHDSDTRKRPSSSSANLASAV
jgi:hypothetical protein